MAEMDQKMSEMKYKQGDILTTGNYFRKVLGVCGEVYLMSYDMQSAEEIDHVDFDVGFSQSLLDGCNYRLYTTPEEVEMTVAEISEALGKTVKVVE